MNKNQFDTIEKAEAFLLSIPKFGNVGRSAANFSLDRMISFCELMGNPQNSVPMIHVAGTNGKGTTCQMLASVYQEAGYKTGLYTSPHLIDVRERFKVNGEWIDDEHLLEFFQEFGKEAIELKLTFFELTTAIAFWYFNKQKVDLAIIETGLGGRLDATNVIDPLVSVITSIGYDHTDILGDTLEEIAAEKAGIIKLNRPVVLGRLEPEAQSVIESIASAKNSEVYHSQKLNPEFKDGHFVLHPADNSIYINAKGRKKIDAVNTAMAWMVVGLTQSTFPVPDEAFVDGIEKMDQRFGNHAHFSRIHPKKSWYFDGAHNVESTRELVKELKSMASVENWTAVLSFMDDKLNQEIADIWNEFPNIMVFEQEGDRAASIKKMNSYFPSSKAINSDKATQLFTSDDNKTELVIFSGSFYFYKTVRNWMGTEAYENT
ncbi:bifunctional folylpolyglutamate synthase/dihydrofolate synthase [Rhodohalobacter sp.]|uniref:bifunctional folylpolyglutamate synthase/dihydrofolate synthase n=1 Tax=Rhodohalobacter sp. TaxID=1974210 RepID=UPI002ACD2E47|nr:Mur ligase family protein [Rhodohalobacter sp.]MDZ7757609.1 Mur ligase family protein [Rhodohalobacter sp.]